MFLSREDVEALLLSLQLATTVTSILFLAGTPLAWWLSGKRNRIKDVLGAVVSLPIVLPPSVLGFYLLLGMGPGGPLGKLTAWAGIEALPFSYWGVVVGSVFYSLPFMVQPLQSAFEAVGTRPMEVAATLRAHPLDAFCTVLVPLCLPGFMTAGILTFAHTMGEFGVVLMIGGNIPGSTRVASVQIYDHVQAMEYTQSHHLSLVLLGFSLVVLVGLNLWRSKPDKAR